MMHGVNDSLFSSAWQHAQVLGSKLNALAFSSNVSNSEMGTSPGGGSMSLLLPS